MSRRKENIRFAPQKAGISRIRIARNGEIISQVCLECNNSSVRHINNMRIKPDGQIVSKPQKVSNKKHRHNIGCRMFGKF